MYPTNFRYTKEHEWVRVEGDIGAVRHLCDGDGSAESRRDRQHQHRDATLGQSCKEMTSPEKLNADPHGEAWLVKIKLSAPGEIQQLLSAGDYQNYIGAEGSTH